MSKRDTRKTIDAMTKTIVRRFKPEKVILFGSHAWGRPYANSDVDLFIIQKTRRSTRAVAREMDDALWGRTIPLDLIVSTPRGVSQSLQNGNFFVRKVLESGKILYER